MGILEVADCSEKEFSFISPNGERVIFGYKSEAGGEQAVTQVHPCLVTRSIFIKSAKMSLFSRLRF